MIVLVITIIVIIILAVAVILTLSNNNPIENAHRAVSDNNEAVKKEAVTLAYADWYLQENSDNKTGKSAQEYIEDALKAQGIDTTGLLVSNNGTIVTNAPTIPNGFKYLEGTVETGFVIQNITDKNEFVWVPVEVPAGKKFEESFVRYSFGDEDSNKTIYEEPYTNEGEITESEEMIEYNAMVASVKKYGGFYIGRYEASETNPESGVAQSKGNKDPWGNISWGESMTNPGENGAVGKARAVYPAKDATTEGDPVSTLPYGVQWDATVKFLMENYTEDQLTIDSTGLGNYADVSNYETILAGSNPQYALNNIYDMAGNVMEWTMEVASLDGDYYRVCRGGNYNIDGISSPVSDRSYYYTVDYSDPCQGFRLALYIK